ncbi:hypothetical protein SpCBS45565_g01026 [Spizellomyces sp. 'palustris']|nr:hypothetical protein SpCBS45565_g01026 [Spizellomyces sp. 'palustris']
MPSAKRKTADAEIATSTSPDDPAEGTDAKRTRRSTRVAAATGKEKLAAMTETKAKAPRKKKADEEEASPTSPTKKTRKKKQDHIAGDDGNAPTSPTSSKGRTTKKSKEEESDTAESGKKDTQNGNGAAKQEGQESSTGKGDVKVESPKKKDLQSPKSEPKSPTKESVKSPKKQVPESSKEEELKSPKREGPKSPTKESVKSPQKEAPESQVKKESVETGSAIADLVPPPPGKGNLNLVPTLMMPTYQSFRTLQNILPGVLEKGHIFFFYRPKVEKSEAKGIDDVQRFYIVLKPDVYRFKSEDDKESHVYHGHRIREIIVTRKKLPEIGSRARYWGFVDHVVDDVKDLEQYLRGETYETKTRDQGTRHLEPARPCGEGVYSIVDHNGHTHLAYVLALPEEPTEVQKTFNIEKEGSYILSVKNPETPSPPWAGLGERQKSKLPPKFLEHFRGRKFIPANPPALLDFDHIEVLLIGAAEDVSEDLGQAGKELEEMEEEEHKDVVKLQDDKVFQE